MKQTDLEREFETRARQCGLTIVEREWKFHPTRKWRFDFCWPEQLVAVECEGGTWSGGAHTQGSGFEDDAHKYNAATSRGWRVFRFTTSMLRTDPAGCCELVKKALEGEIR
jgi:very-short-patch-repair endonuclease